MKIFIEIENPVCQVENILPTVSACISRRPQCYIWRFLIALHAAPRFLFGPCWYRYHTQEYVGMAQAHHVRYTFTCNMQCNVFYQDFFLFMFTLIVSNFV